MFIFMFQYIYTWWAFNVSPVNLLISYSWRTKLQVTIYRANMLSGCNFLIHFKCFHVNNLHFFCISTEVTCGRITSKICKEEVSVHFVSYLPNIVIIFNVVLKIAQTFFSISLQKLYLEWFSWQHYWSDIISKIATLTYLGMILLYFWQIYQKYSQSLEEKFWVIHQCISGWNTLPIFLRLVQYINLTIDQTDKLW